MPPIILPLLLIVLVAVVAIWLINKIPFPAGLEIIKTILICVVVFLALSRLLTLW